MRQTQTTPYGELKKHAENKLNLAISDNYKVETERQSGTLWDMMITVPGDRNTEETVYHLRICVECGNTQAMNLATCKRVNPTIVRQAREAVKRREIKEYEENGTPTAYGDALKRKIEDWLNLEWDNSMCETRHPPRP